MVVSAREDLFIIMQLAFIWILAITAGVFARVMYFSGLAFPCACLLPSFIHEPGGAMGRSYYLLTCDHFVTFHWGQELALQLIELCGFVFGSHLVVPVLQVTERCLRPSPQVTEH